MAIEFDCPYCTATIRVPDAYGGKQGRCPKCDTKMLVPTVARPDADAAANSMVATQPTGIQSTAESLPETDEFQLRTNVGTGSTVRRRPARRRPSRTLVVGIPVLLLLVILGIVGYTLIGMLPDLSGELFARKMNEQSLPGVTINWSETGLTPEDVDVLREHLRTNPETFNSQVMTCRFIGADDGIEVQLTAGSNHEWFAVDTTTSNPLTIWIRKERPRLNPVRAELLQKSLQAYCRDKITRIRGGNAPMDAMAVRDNVGLNASGGVLSFVVHAVIGKMAVPCSGEDANGTIYFCLPSGTLAFQIQGRTLPDKNKPFAGEFSAIVVPSKPAADETKTELPPADDVTIKDATSDEADKAAGSETGDPTEGNSMPAAETPAPGDAKM